MLTLQGFNITPDDGDSYYVLHRDIAGPPHLEDRHCWCCPLVVPRDEYGFMTMAQVRKVMQRQVQ